ncbi:MAG: protein-S-isoprenylcysteine O-methyltransferase [Anaerolineae bacterium]
MIGSIFRVFYFIGLIVGLAIQVLHTRQSQQNRITRDRKTGLDTLLTNLASLGVLLPLIYVLSPWLDFADYRLPTWAGWVGAAVFVVALWLLWRSHADLGRNWWSSLEIREGHTLVTQGAFRYIRHPMYASYWLWGIAQALLIQNWIAGLPGLVLLLPWYLLRVPREEQMMLEHFGEEYRLYINRTGRVIPLLWRQLATLREAAGSDARSRMAKNFWNNDWDNGGYDSNL